MHDVKAELDKLQVERNRLGQTASLAPKDTRPHVVFMTPSIDHKVSVGYLQSFILTVSLLTQHGWAFSFQSFGGDPYLAKVRNLCVSECLRRFPDASHLFFLDADLEWDPEAVVRLLQHPGDITAGIYCKKNDTPDFPSSLVGVKDTTEFAERDGLIKALMVPTGFLCVRREVYAAMAATAKKYKDSMGGGVECWNIFEMGFCPEPQPDGMDGQWWGEDTAWCRKALEMGYDLLVDPTATFGHMGNKTWRFQFRDFVQGYKDGKAKVIEKSEPGADEKIVAVQGLLAAE